jgi:hypothetical protein
VKFARGKEKRLTHVLAILSNNDEELAIRIANDTIYSLGNGSLGSGVWSSDHERAARVARHLRTGQVEINGGKFNLLAPFGGEAISNRARGVSSAAVDASCSSPSRPSSANPQDLPFSDGLPRPPTCNVSSAIGIRVGVVRRLPRLPSHDPHS